jgi:hypothetical protein
MNYRVDLPSAIFIHNFVSPCPVNKGSLLSSSRPFIILCRLRETDARSTNTNRQHCFGVEISLKLYSAVLKNKLYTFMRDKNYTCSAKHGVYNV